MTFLSDAINQITNEIIATARCVSSEQRSPSRSSDDSEERISDGLLTIKKLRAIREQLEEIHTGALL